MSITYITENGKQYVSDVNFISIEEEIIKIQWQNTELNIVRVEGDKIIIE